MISGQPSVKRELNTNTDIISPSLYRNNSSPGFTEHQPGSKKVKLLLALPFHFQQSPNSQTVLRLFESFDVLRKEILSSSGPGLFQSIHIQPFPSSTTGCPTPSATSLPGTFPSNTPQHKMSQKAKPPITPQCKVSQKTNDSPDSVLVGLGGDGMRCLYFGLGSPSSPWGCCSSSS